MSATTTKRQVDIDAESALAALRRARQRAERIALATNTCIVQSVDGKPVRVSPHPAALHDQSSSR
jgi:hypothetical protein